MAESSFSEFYFNVLGTSTQTRIVFTVLGAMGIPSGASRFQQQRKQISKYIKTGTALRYFLPILPLLVIYIHTSSLYSVP